MPVDKCEKNGLFQGHRTVDSFSAPLPLILNDNLECSIPIHPDHTLIPLTSALKIEAGCSYQKVISTEKVKLCYNIKDALTRTFVITSNVTS